MIRWAKIDADGTVANIAEGPADWPVIDWPNEWVECDRSTQIGQTYSRDKGTFE